MLLDHHTVPAAASDAMFQELGCVLLTATLCILAVWVWQSETLRSDLRKLELNDKVATFERWHTADSCMHALLAWRMLAAE